MAAAGSGERKKVVVIGGGVSSKHTVEELVKDKTIEVVMIQACSFVEWPLAMTSVLSNPTLHTKALAPDPAKFQVKGAAYIYGVVAGVDAKAKEIKLADAEAPVKYDALVVATGFRMPLFYPKPGATLAARRQEVAEAGAAIGKAACVGIGGGGVIGLELAGDIRVAYPTKRIVVFCRDTLLSNYPADFLDKVRVELQKRKIEVVEGCKKEPMHEVSLEQRTVSHEGTDYCCDVFIPAFLQGPNTSFLGDSEPSSGKGLLDEAGKVVVNDRLQCPSAPEIFAVGVSTAGGFVGIAKLQDQWTAVARNVKAILSGKPLKPMKESMKNMQRPPYLLVGRGKGGWAMWDISQLPPPLQCCCCCGMGGFPFCPPPCCWPCCGPCACGMCGCPSSGEGPARCMGGLDFFSSSLHFKGVGQDAALAEQAAPAQESMGSKEAWSGANAPQ